jgi:hypothetical protein
MSTDDEFLLGLAAQLPKPLDSASREAKQEFSQRISNIAAVQIASALRARGLKETLPDLSAIGSSGAERRLAGGIGAKRVDVSWATDVSGLLLAVSIKSINFRDMKSNNFQKNLTNRRGDLLIEAVTLHRRFPYAVIGGLLILDAGAASDDTAKRKSTFENAGYQLRLFRDRRDPAGRDEQLEELAIVLFDSSAGSPSIQSFSGPTLSSGVTVEWFLDNLVERVAERNSDFYELKDGQLFKRPS